MKRNRPSTSSVSRRTSLAMIILSALLASAIGATAQAATITWSNAAGGAWSNAANWSPATVPGSGDAAVLPALSGAYTVTLDVNPSAASVTIANGDPTLDVNGQSIAAVGALSNSGTIVNFAGAYSGAVIANHTGGRIVSADGGTISIGGNITNDGTIQISGTGSQLSTVGGATVDGAGSIVLAGGTIVDVTGSGPNGGRLRLTGGQTLTGIGHVTISVENHGTILASTASTEAAGYPELRFMQGASILNYGTVLLENGGRIRMEGSDLHCASTTARLAAGPGGGTFDTANLDFGRWGTIDLSHGGAVEMNGGDLTVTCEWMWGGPIRSVGDGGAMKISVGGLEQVSVEANTDVYVTDHIDFIGGDAGLPVQHVTIDGKLHVPGSFATTLAYPDTLHLSGSGSVELEGGSIGSATAAAGVIVCDSGFLIHGTGTINPPFVNNGTVDLSGSLKVPAGTNPWRNNGLIRIGRGGLLLSGANVRLVNAGRIQTTDANGALQILKGATVDNRGGVITASAGPVRIGNLDNYGNLIGGRLESAAGGEFVVGRGATLTNVTVGTTGVLHVNPSATAIVSGSLTNLGTVRITGSGRISDGGAGQYVQKDGATWLEGGLLATSRDLQVEGGMVKGFGTITANVRSRGTLAPDAGAALRIAGNYTQLTGGTLQVAIAGADQASRLDVSGIATLAGSLSPVLAGGFAPRAGQSFKVLTYDAVAGSFDPAFAAAGTAPQLNPVFAAGAMSLVANGTTAVGDPVAVATLEFAARNTPAGTSFVLALPEAAQVKGRVYDAAGREVAVLADGALASGVHTFAVNRAGGVSLASGVYFARVSVLGGGIEQVRTARAIVVH